MQIRTAIAIGIGIAIGTMIGIGVDEDKKIRMINRFKKKLIYAMTGEEWKPKKFDPTKTPYKRTTYNDIYKTKTSETRNNDWNYLTIFGNREDAENIISVFEKQIGTYGFVTVHDLATMSSKHIDYTWDVYGWTTDMIMAFDGVNIQPVIGGMYKIVLPDPKLLTDEDMGRKK